MVDRLAFKDTSRTNQQAHKQGSNDRNSQPQTTVGFWVIHTTTLRMEIGILAEARPLFLDCYHDLSPSAIGITCVYSPITELAKIFL